MFHVEHIFRSYIFMSQPQLIIFCEIKIVLRGTISRKQINVSRGTICRKQQLFHAEQSARELKPSHLAMPFSPFGELFHVEQ